MTDEQLKRALRLAQELVAILGNDPAYNREVERINATPLNQTYVPEEPTPPPDAVVEWLLAEIEKRFPGTPDPTAEDLNTLLTETKADRVWLEDLLDVAEKFDRTKSKVKRPVGVMIYQARRFPPEQIHPEAERWRWSKQNDKGTIVQLAKHRTAQRVSTDTSPGRGVSQIERILALKRAKEQEANAVGTPTGA